MRNIDLSSEGLTTLKGQKIPDVVDGYFNCVNNELTSLEFGPKEVYGYFNCAYNYLSNLKFGPEEVHGIFNCEHNKLTSLEFCPTKIERSLYADDNRIGNLKDIHKQFKNGYIKNMLSLYKNPLKSHLLGVILIPQLGKINIDNKTIKDILNNHLITKDVLDCQEELIQNGFKEFAQL